MAGSFVKGPISVGVVVEGELNAGYGGGDVGGCYGGDVDWHVGGKSIDGLFGNGWILVIED